MKEKEYLVLGKSTRYAEKRVWAKSKTEARKLANNDCEWEEIEPLGNEGVEITGVEEVEE